MSLAKPGFSRHWTRTACREMAKKEKGPGKSTKLDLHSRNKRVLEGMGSHLGPPSTVAGAGVGQAEASSTVGVLSSTIQSPWTLSELSVDSALLWTGWAEGRGLLLEGTVSSRACVGETGQSQRVWVSARLGKRTFVEHWLLQLLLRLCGQKGEVWLDLESCSQTGMAGSGYVRVRKRGCLRKLEEEGRQLSRKASAGA